MSRLIFLSYQLDKIRNSVKKRGRFIFIGFGFSLFLNLAVWLLLYFRLFLLVKNLPSVPLHYNVYFGIDWIGSPITMFLLPLFGFLTILANLILSYIVYIKEKLWSYFLTSGTILIETFILLVSIFVVLINL